MRSALIAAVLPALFLCNAAIAQVGGMPTTPTLGATSPLGQGPGSAVSDRPEFRLAPPRSSQEALVRRPPA